MRRSRVCSRGSARWRDPSPPAPTAQPRAPSVPHQTSWPPPGAASVKVSPRPSRAEQRAQCSHQQESRCRQMRSLQPPAPYTAQYRGEAADLHGSLADHQRHAPPAPLGGARGHGGCSRALATPQAPPPSQPLRVRRALEIERGIVRRADQRARSASAAPSPQRLELSRDRSARESSAAVHSSHTSEGGAG